MKIPGIKPYFGGEKKIEEITQDIKQVLESGILSSGNYTKKFEKSSISIQFSDCGTN